MLQQAFGFPLMAAINTPFESAFQNRRRRVRHKIQTPAYATFDAVSKGAALDLHEVVDISEEGVALQCHWPLEVDAQLNLCLDLADCPQQIFTTGQVVWSNESGRAGIHFSSLPPDSLSRLREWLFVNVMAGVANSEVDLSVPFPSQHVTPRPNYTDTLAAVTAVQRQVEALGSDLAAALQLIAERAQVLVRASGAAIALADNDPDYMTCRASSGSDAPPVGARLRIGTGFSAECVKRGTLLRCDDAELDDRVDRESCRALGIRSILATPVRAADKSVGLIEAFSAEANTFAEADGRVLQRLAETVLDAANRAARAENLPTIEEAAAKPFVAPQGSVLFASSEETKEPEKEQKQASGITLPRSYLVILTLAAATIALVLGILTAPWIQSEALPWVKNKLYARAHAQLPTVLASTEAPKTHAADPTVQTASFDQLKQMAEKGDAAAENALALRYFEGDERDSISHDEAEAAHWFTMAAEHGSVPAQSKLGFLYWGGNHGLSKDLNKAYLWTNIALLHPANPTDDPAVNLSRTLSQHLRIQLTAEQAKAIERQAHQWIDEHPPSSKPNAGR